MLINGDHQSGFCLDCMQDHSGHARDQTRLLGILQQALPTAFADRPDKNMLGQQVKKVIEFNMHIYTQCQLYLFVCVDLWWADCGFV